MKTVIRFVQTITVMIACFMSTIAAAQWQGTWDTDFGKVRLRQYSNYVYGDYGTWGTVRGYRSNNGQTMRGEYRRNDNGTKGFFEWRLVNARRFEGGWSKTETPFPKWNEPTYKWGGDKLNAVRPPLSVFTGGPDAVPFMRGQTPRFIRWMQDLTNTRPSSTAQSAAPRRPNTNGLDYGRKLTPAKLKTAFEMQKFVRAISKKGGIGRSNGEAEAKGAIEALGYTLLGRGIINETGNNVALTRAAVAVKNDAIVVSFRGTKGDTFAETVTAGVMIDGRVERVQPSFIPSTKRGGALVHKGFHNSYLNLRDQIHDAFAGQRNKHLFVTGHSLGGALAQLMVWDMAVNFRGRFASITLITSGAPRVGNAAFAQRFARDVPDSLRILVHKDPVPAVPWLDGAYVHAGKSLVIGRDDGVLIQHKDQIVRPATFQFLRYHGNAKYYSAVQKLSQRAPSNGRLNPNGDDWATNASLSWFNLSQEKRGKAKKAIKRIKGVFQK